MVEVLIVGAGPAGAAAAIVLARAGVRLLLVDRARFPRDKLCGDTINAGTLAWLGALGVREQIERKGVALEGMVVTSGSDQVVAADYGRGVTGRALQRRVLDLVLLEAAAAAGAHVEQGARVTEAIPDGGGVRGCVVEARGRKTRIPAVVTIAADGRRSSLAFGLGLARHPREPRRWAIGTYMTGVHGLGAMGEMHVRVGHYIGVAPLPDGLANVCLVTTPRPGFDDPGRLLRTTLQTDPLLAERCADAREVGPPSCAGPLAVDATGAGAPGLLLAGDAAGFIDPMTGDGLRFAVHGGILAAEVALKVLEKDRRDGHEHLARLRADAFGTKQRFNRFLRSLVATPTGLGAGRLAARIAPPLLQAVVRYAGDIGVVAPRAEGHVT